MIQTFVTFHVLPGRTGEFEAIHRELLEQVCAMPGCIDVDVHRSAAEPTECMGAWTLGEQGRVGAGTPDESELPKTLCAFAGGAAQLVARQLLRAGVQLFGRQAGASRGLECVAPARPGAPLVSRSRPTTRWGD